MDSNQMLEELACTPVSLDTSGFNKNVVLPYGLTLEHIEASLNDFLQFLEFINKQLYTKQIARLETMLMPANFSSVVGEFFISSIPKHCSTLIKNKYHNGHPDLLPLNMYPTNSIQHGTEGIEVKASRYLSGWQGHNPEDTWLMVISYDSNRPADEAGVIVPRPFQFLQVVGAKVTKEDWNYSGRSETSRRTITATINAKGYAKMMANVIYKIPSKVS